MCGLQLKRLLKGKSTVVAAPAAAARGRGTAARGRGTAAGRTAAARRTKAIVDDDDEDEDGKTPAGDDGDGELGKGDDGDSPTVGTRLRRRRAPQRRRSPSVSDIEEVDEPKSKPSRRDGRVLFSSAWACRCLGSGGLLSLAAACVYVCVCVWVCVRARAFLTILVVVTS